jgi:hypothetical protein
MWDTAALASSLVGSHKSLGVPMSEHKGTQRMEKAYFGGTAALYTAGLKRLRKKSIAREIPALSG